MAQAIETPDGPLFTSVVHECCEEVQELRARIEKALALYNQPTSEVSKLLLLKQIRDVLQGKEPTATEEPAAASETAPTSEED